MAKHPALVGLAVVARARHATSSRAFRGALAIVGGSAGAQLLIALSMPFLSRVFSPTEFGAFAVATSLIITLGAVGALRFDAAVPIPERRPVALDVVRLAALCVLGFLVVGTAVSVLWRTEIANALNVPVLASYLWLVPACGALLSGFQLLNQLAIRDQRYAATARRALYAAVVTVTVQLTLGVLGVGYVGLMLGYGAGQLVGLLSLVGGASLASRAISSRSFRTRIGSVGRRFIRFPLFLAPAALLNVLSLQLPTVLLAVLYGADESGFLGMTQRALGMPIALVGVAIGQVYLGEMSNAIRRDPGRARAMFRRASWALSAIGVATSIPILVAGSWAFTTVLGQPWERSGHFAQAMAIALAAQLLASPLSSTLTVLERQGVLLSLDAVRLTLTAGSMILVSKLGGSPLESVWALSVSSFVTYLAYWYFSSRALQSAMGNGNSS